jgi:carbamoyl-phosphate synthase small subunit
VRNVTCTEAYDWNEGKWQLGEGYKRRAQPKASKRRGKGSFNAPGFFVVAYDFGIKYNILRNLAESGCLVRVVPATMPAEDVLALNPDGVFLSNGPGDPDAVPYAKENVEKLIGKKPIFGICLGHQIMGLALGGKTYKLKFGHHGGNQPVMDLTTRKVEITAQNHGFAVDADSLKGAVEVTHFNLNDDTVEGLAHRELPIFSVQYHPESSPGPHDANYLFQRFIKLMQDNRKN